MNTTIQTAPLAATEPPYSVSYELTQCEALLFADQKGILYGVRALAEGGGCSRTVMISPYREAALGMIKFLQEQLVHPDHIRDAIATLQNRWLDYQAE